MPLHLGRRPAGLARDVQLNILLIGDLFLALAYVQRPTAWRGVALGAMVGLTQLSRDNALSMVSLVVFPAVVGAVVRRSAGAAGAGCCRSPGGHSWCSC